MDNFNATLVTSAAKIADRLARDLRATEKKMEIEINRLEDDIMLATDGTRRWSTGNLEVSTLNERQYRLAIAIKRIREAATVIGSKTSSEMTTEERCRVGV